MGGWVGGWVSRGGGGGGGAAHLRVTLPRPSRRAATLLDDFLQTKAKRTSHERLYGEVCDGMRSYFNQALSALLLYKYERKQLRDIKEQVGAKPLVEAHHDPVTACNRL